MGGLNFGNNLFNKGVFKESPNDGQVRKSRGSRDVPEDDTNTDTTYTAGTGVDLTGTEFTSDDSAIVHDSLSGFNVDKHREWAASIAQNIHANNYTNTLPTKEYFWYVSPATADGSGGNSLVFKVPYDFNSITSITLVLIPSATNGTANIDLTSVYGAVGEDYNNHTESDAASTYSLVANKVTEIDISGVFSNLATNDYGGIFVTNNSENIIIYGVKLRYT